MDEQKEPNAEQKEIVLNSAFIYVRLAERLSRSARVEINRFKQEIADKTITPTEEDTELLNQVDAAVPEYPDMPPLQFPNVNRTN